MVGTLIDDSRRSVWRDSHAWQRPPLLRGCRRDGHGQRRMTLDCEVVRTCVALTASVTGSNVVVDGGLMETT